jgi:hypothetical protein
LASVGEAGIVFLERYSLYLRAGLVMIAGLLLGLFTTVLSLNAGYGFNALEAGPWTAWPSVGVPDSDPYARAVVARTGETPLGRDQGLVFTASTDSSGAPLDGACDYSLEDPTPPARFWTLGIVSPRGSLFANPTGRFGYSSVDILRHEGGGFNIHVSRNIQTGNWLSPGEARQFNFILRLYDTTLDVDTQPKADHFPKITKLNCA